MKCKDEGSAATQFARIAWRATVGHDGAESVLRCKVGRLWPTEGGKEWDSLPTRAICILVRALVTR